MLVGVVNAIVVSSNRNPLRPRCFLVILIAAVVISFAMMVDNLGFLTKGFFSAYCLQLKTPFGSIA